MYVFRCNDPYLRTRLLKVWHLNIADAHFNRLQFIIKHDWNHLVSQYWIKYGLELLLPIFYSSDPILLTAITPTLPPLLPNCMPNLFIQSHNYGLAYKQQLDALVFGGHPNAAKGPTAAAEEATLAGQAEVRHVMSDVSKLKDTIKQFTGGQGGGGGTPATSPALAPANAPGQTDVDMDSAQQGQQTGGNSGGAAAVHSLKGTLAYVVDVRGRTCTEAMEQVGSEAAAIARQHALFLMHVGAPRISSLLSNLQHFAQADSELMQQLWL